MKPHRPRPAAISDHSLHRQVVGQPADLLGRQRTFGSPRLGG